MAGSRRTNLLIGGAAAAAGVAAAYNLYIWFSAYFSDPFHNDLTFYYAAAQLGLTHGWSHLYDLKLQQDQLTALGSQIHIAQLARYVSPPPLAWLVVPLTAVPFNVAYWVWSGLLVAALVFTWKVAAPGGGRARVIYLVAAVGWLPLIYGLYLSQPVLLVAAAVAACYALLQRDRQVLAGVVLGLLVLKPQLAILVPPALLVSGRWRAFGAAAITLGALALLSALALGPHGISDYEQRLAFATTVPENQAQTLAAWIHNLPVTRAVQVTIDLWTLALIYRLRACGPGRIISIALVGGLAASPYAHWDDMAMIGLAGWLFLREAHSRWAPFYIAALVVAAELFPFFGAGPVLAGELIALGLMSAISMRNGDDGFQPAEPQPPTPARADAGTPRTPSSG